MSRSILMNDAVTLRRGTTYRGSLLGSDGPILLGLGAIARNGGFRSDKVKRYSGDSDPSILLEPGDLFISLKDVTHSADLLGAVARVPLGVTSGRLTQDTVGLTITDARVSTSYLYWMLRTPQYRAYCRERATGTTNLGLSRVDFLAYQFPVPSDDLEAITELLGALEEKNSVNIKTCTLVQELASAMFHHATEGVAEKASAFTELTDLGGGGTPSTAVAEYWKGENSWATPTDVTSLAGPYLNKTARSISTAGLAACSSPLYPAGSILMTSRATIGAFAIAERPMAVNQGFIVVQPHDERLKWWIFHEMQSRVDEFISHANGATFLELSRGKFKQLPVRLADETTMYKFNDKAESLHAVARAALRENVTLAALRDTLLPELMSGRMHVRDAEEQVGEVL